MRTRRASRSRAAWAGRLAACVLVLALAAALAPREGRGSPYIDVQVSIKVIRNPANGSRPPIDPPGVIPLSDGKIAQMFAVADDSLMSSFWRGYRYVIYEVVDVGTPCTSCNTSNPSFWYNTSFNPEDPVDSLTLFQNAAVGNPSYAWRPNAINVYFNGQGDGGVCSFPGRDVVMFGSRVFNPAYRYAFAGGIFTHEIGHYFNLLHTHDSQPGCPDGTPAECSSCGGGDDDVTDTLLDRFCFGGIGWTWLDVAHRNYGSLWGDTPQQHAAVDNTFYNNMSYHNGGLAYGQFVDYLRTEGQLDRWTDAAKIPRAAVRTGRTWFACVGCSGTGSSTSPMSLAQAQSQAQPGDIVLLRPGHYGMITPIQTPMTLRATRVGPATIGQ